MRREDADTKMCCINAPARAVTPVVLLCGVQGKRRGLRRVQVQRRESGRLGQAHYLSPVFTSCVRVPRLTLFSDDLSRLDLMN